jgi:hypothetical protein
MLHEKVNKRRQVNTNQPGERNRDVHVSQYPLIFSSVACHLFFPSQRPQLYPAELRNQALQLVSLVHGAARDRISFSTACRVRITERRSSPRRLKPNSASSQQLEAKSCPFQPIRKGQAAGTAYGIKLDSGTAAVAGPHDPSPACHGCGTNLQEKLQRRF